MLKISGIISNFKIDILTTLPNVLPILIKILINPPMGYTNTSNKIVLPILTNILVIDSVGNTIIHDFTKETFIMH